MISSFPVGADPVDSYVELSVNKALEEANLTVTAVHWPNEMRPGRIVAFQRLAAAIGLAYLDPESQLCVHPSLGPWFALRAMIVLDLPPSAAPRPLCASPLDESTRERVKVCKTQCVCELEFVHEYLFGTRLALWSPLDTNNRVIICMFVLSGRLR
jgi:hypothetical protein